MTITLNALQKQRRDTASNWTSNNPTLLDGELGYETDTKKFKIGDGSTAWQSLDYLPIPDTNRLLAGNLTVGGNFQVNGTTTTIDTTTLTVEDKNIEIGKVSSPSDTTADGGGLTLLGSTNKTFNWVNSTDSWTSSEHLDLASGKVVKVAGTQILSATQYTGNSATTTALATARTISGVSFDGTQNITLNNNAITNGAGYLTDLVSDSSPQLGGNLDSNTRDIHLNNSGDVALRWQLSGTNKWSIFHNTSGSSNHLEIFDNNGSKTAAKFITNGAAELYHSNAKKLETTSWGVLSGGYIKSEGSSGKFILDDNGKFEAGDSGDLKLFHDGSNSHIKSDTNALIIRSDALRINNNGNTETMIKADVDGAVELYHGMGGSAAEKKLETSSTGVKITGNDATGSENYGSISYKTASGTVRGFFNTTNDRFEFKDNFYSTYGNNQDLQIYHAGDHSYISDTGTGQLRIWSNDLRIQDTSGNSGIQMLEGGAVYLYHSGSQKFETTSTGATVTGNITATKLLSTQSAGSAGLGFGDNVQIHLGTSDDFKIYHDNSINYLKGTGSHPLTFSTNNNERMRIDSSGHLLVSRTASIHGGKLSLDYTNGTTAGMAIKDTQTSGTGVPLQVVNGSGTIVGSITMNQSNTAFNISSDYRLKENVVAISDGITRLKTLKPSRFNWISDLSNTTIDGFLAHEVTAVPEAVQGEKDAVATEDNEKGKKGDPIYQQIDLSKLVPLLTAALQEAITKIETLETKVAALEAA